MHVIVPIEQDMTLLATLLVGHYEWTGCGCGMRLGGDHVADPSGRGPAGPIDSEPQILRKSGCTTV